MEPLTLTLPGCGAVVTYKPELSWWDVQELEAPAIAGVRAAIGKDGEKMNAEFSPTVLMDIKKKLMERAILSVQPKGAEAGPYTFEWLQTLSQTDGSLLDEALDALKKK